ncbi:MAG: DUF4364 family protein [Clostridia bacterium]|nr:DUF4364 family protein [Clostridia bacterium]
MKSGHVYYDKTDIKIIILALLCATADPLDADTLEQVICRDELVGAFDFAECFAELEELGHIEYDAVDGVRYYQVTDTGRQVARELQDSIPEDIRRRNALEASKLVALRLGASRAACEIREDAPFCLTVICDATDKAGKVLHLEIRAADRVQAEAIRRHFLDRPSSCLRGIYSALAGDVDYLLS